MKCDEVQGDLNALIDSELGLVRYLDVRLHLLKCAKCREHLNAYRKLQRLVASGGPKDRSPSPWVLKGVMSGTVVVACTLAFILWPAKGVSAPQPAALIYAGPPGPGVEPISCIYKYGNQWVAKRARQVAEPISLEGPSSEQAVALYEVATSSVPEQPIRISTAHGRSTDAVVYETGHFARSVHSTEAPSESEITVGPAIVVFSGSWNEARAIPVPEKAETYYVHVVDPALKDTVIVGRTIRPTSKRP